MPELRTQRQRAGRQPLPEHLPRIEHRHEPETCTCGQGGGELAKIGEDISEQLDVEPAKFFVHRHIRPQYACRPCERITAAPVPPAVIDGGLAAPGLITWVLISKFLDHLPLYRLEQIAARNGVTLGPLDPVRVGRPLRRGLAAPGGSAGRAIATTIRAARR